MKYEINLVIAFFIAIIGFWIKVKEVWAKKIMAILLISFLALLFSRFYWAYTHQNVLKDHISYLYELRLRNVSLLGGVFGAGLGLFLISKWFHSPFFQLTDSLLFSFALALLLSRLGCLSHGCCFGARTNVWWALEVEKGMPAYEAYARKNVFSVFEDIHIHPTQVYELINIIFAYTLSCLAERKITRISGIRTLFFFLMFTLGHGVVMAFRFPNSMAEPLILRYEPIYLQIAFLVLVILILRLLQHHKNENQRRKSGS